MKNYKHIYDLYIKHIIKPILTRSENKDFDFEFDDFELLDINPEFTEPNKIIADKIFVGVAKGKKKVLHVEVQRTNVPKMDVKMFQTLARIIDKFHPNDYQFTQVVIYIGKEKCTMSQGFSINEWPWDFLLVKLNEFSCDTYLNAKSAEESVLTVFTDIPQDRETDIIGQMCENIIKLTDNDEDKRFQLMEMAAEMAPRETIKELIIKIMNSVIEVFGKQKPLEERYYYKRIMEQGKIEKQKEMARAMLLDAQKDDFITKYTGLTPEQIDEIRKGL